MKNTIVVLIAIVIFCVSGCAEEESYTKALTGNEGDSVQADQDNKDIKKRPKYYSSEPSAVHINDHVLKIPTWYIVQNPGDNKFVSMYAFWPGLVPHAKRNINSTEDEKLSRRQYDKIEILINGGSTMSELPEERLVETRLGSSKVLEDPAYNKILELWDYRRSVDRDKPHYFFARDYHTPLDPEAPLFIDCSYKPQDRPTEGVRCQVSYFVKDDIRVTNRFYYKHIRDWKKIDQEVRVFINSLFGGE